MNQIPETQIRRSLESLYSYGDNNKIVYIRGPMRWSSFSYENGLLTGYTFWLSEAIEYDIQNEDGKMKRIYISEFNSPKHDVNYFIYQNDLIIQSIDSLYDFDEGAQLLGSTEFEYDENENLIKETIIRSGEIVEEIQYEYDDKVNPFYQMYHSWHKDFSPITSPNNVVKIVSTNFTDSNKSYNREFNFEYDSRGYPISIYDESIEYYNYSF